LKEEDSTVKEFQELVEDRFHYGTDDAWEGYYARMAPYVHYSDAQIRRKAIERLCMAVFFEEGMSFWRREPKTDMPAENAVRRVRWLIDQMTSTHAVYPDTLPAFLDQLRRNGDKEPYSGPVLAWLHSLQANPPAGVRPDLIQGTLILAGDCGETWPESAPRWIAFLDDASNYVRACAAMMLGKHCSGATEIEVSHCFDLIKSKELIRPGIAGPFWSGFPFDYQGSFNACEWMMEILEKRNGPEPEDLPFTGVDFHLHELCSGSIPSIERMLQSGHKALAFKTATESQGIVEGMKEILLRLGEDADPAWGRIAWEHLARHYHVLHHRARKSEFLSFFAEWAPGADLFVIRLNWGDPWLDVAVLYPAEGQASFEDAEAWKLIDRLLPPALRGEIAPNRMNRTMTGPCRMDDALLYDFTSGAHMTLEGRPDLKQWTRIDIIGFGLQQCWNPGGLKECHKDEA
jgi:hypothetical protein